MGKHLQSLWARCGFGRVEWEPGGSGVGISVQDGVGRVMVESGEALGED